MNDAILLGIMTNKVNLQSYAKFIKDHTISENTQLLLKEFNKFFQENTTCTSIDLAEFRTWFFYIRHPTMKSDRATLISKLLDMVEKEQITPSGVATNVIEYFVQLDYACRIRHESDQFILGVSEDMAELSNLLRQYEAIDISSIEAEFTTTDLEDLIESTIAGKGLDWRLKEFNEILGPLRKGDFIILAARPETGKTTTLASEITYMAKQLDEDQNVLWICNEESGNKIQFRVFQAALGRTKEDILADIPAAKADIVAELGRADRIKVFHKPYIDYREVDKLCSQVNPGLIIFDQLDKIHGFKADREDLKLQKLYQWARELGNQYGAVISVSQCDGTAENQKYIQMSQLAGSKTAKQGEADAIIMLGVDPSYEYNRYIHVPKNKLAGGPHSIESLRHGKAEVLMHPSIARLESFTGGS